MSAERNYVHVNFDEMTCPIKGCESGKGGTPQTGSVPGIKRHVKLVHGEDAYENAKFPPIRTKGGALTDQTTEELFDAALNRRLISDDEKPSRAKLIELLTQ